MSREIHILDDFLSTDHNKAIQQLCLYQKGWEPQTSADPYKSHFSFFYSEQYDNKELLENLFNQTLQKAPVLGDEILRVYSNLAPVGPQYAGDWHCDDGNITLLYFPFPWQSDWLGGTQFRDGKEVHTIEYKQNRLIIFDAVIEHRAQAHINPNGWRYSVAFKTALKWKSD